jgi:hypothetical protein
MATFANNQNLSEGFQCTLIIFQRVLITHLSLCRGYYITLNPVAKGLPSYLTKISLKDLKAKEAVDNFKKYQRFIFNLF